MQRYKWTDTGMYETEDELYGAWYKDGDVEKENERLKKALEDIEYLIESNYETDELGAVMAYILRQAKQALKGEVYDTQI